MGVISINLDIMSPKKRLFAVSAFFCLTPLPGRHEAGLGNPCRPYGVWKDHGKGRLL